MSHSSVFVTTFLAACVEVIEMVIIVVGVGSVRGWRSTWLGADAGLALLAVLVAAVGTALTAVPIGALRMVIGSLLLVFGLDDWTIAATVAVALLVTWVLHTAAVATWWLPPVAAVVVVGVSLHRAAR